jgi:hypothetical protein
VSFNLDQNYPNPFNPSTRITFDLPERADVRLTLVDLLGRETALVTSGAMDAGTHTVTLDAAGTVPGGLAAGAYVYCLTAHTADGALRTDVRRLMILK